MFLLLADLLIHVLQLPRERLHGPLPLLDLQLVLLPFRQHSLFLRHQLFSLVDQSCYLVRHLIVHHEMVQDVVEQRLGQV